MATVFRSGVERASFCCQNQMLVACIRQEFAAKLGREKVPSCTGQCMQYTQLVVENCRGSRSVLVERISVRIQQMATRLLAEPEQTTPVPITVRS